MKIDDLKQRDIQSADSISAILDDLARTESKATVGELRDRVAGGVAFVTFAYDIDGVSMEIAKYAKCFENMFPGTPIHCIAGNFQDKADAVLDDSWQRFQLSGADGWDKWDGGKWFAKLFYEDLPPGSEVSSQLAREMWRQSLDLAERLVDSTELHDVGLLFPVNTNSNPGNVAFALAIVLAAETTGCVTLNNNHDFFWEGGKEGCKRGVGEEPGPRDHFFRNHDNEAFFAFFQRIFPWSGRRWVQLNINPLQERRLIDRFHFRPDDVYTIGTGLEPEFFRACTPDQKHEYRRRMSHVLGGNAHVEPVPVSQFRAGLDAWISYQGPVVCGAQADELLDITSENSLYLLQPTRIVDRKRIWRNWELIAALLEYGPFREVFEHRPELTLTLHVSGPVPIEHRPCLEHLLDAYEAVLAKVPAAIGRRLFQAFSVGWQTDPTSDEELSIVDIYQLADLVVFPSLTEGRGLPIPEAAAAGVPIVCSHYDPPAVFADVVGMHLPPERWIHYEQFPEDSFDDGLLQRITSILLHPESQA
ncbi:MAG: glycosyltransferase, partial [Acidimicrobiia bacterium]